MLGQQDDTYDAGTTFLGNVDANGDYTYAPSEDAFGDGTHWFIDALFSANRGATLDPDEPLPNPNDTTSISNSIGSLNIYPNPANDMVVLNDVNDFASIQVIDMTGKTVMSVNNNAAKNVTLNVTSLEAGIYVIKATGNDKVATQRLIIE